ncbi:MAG: hypothetical protein PHI35_09145 [Victivallaceae bacterium]|nr:hypothetical protein [Victivallaceae bacterium]
MNKSAFVLVMVFVGLSPLFALRPGDLAHELDNVRWMHGSAVTLLPPETDRQKATVDHAEARVVVFFMSRAASTLETFLRMNQLAGVYGRRVAMAAVTPDTAPELDESGLLNGGDWRFAVACDTTRTITPAYMKGSLRYPGAFIVDRTGTVVWFGEAIDLEEALERFFAGKLTIETEAEVAALLDDAESALRENNERRIAAQTDKVLRLDPGNPTALRLRYFVLENSGRAGEALALTLAEIKKRPDLVRLYFSALNLTMRHAAIRGRAGEVVELFRTGPAYAPTPAVLMAWVLLNAAGDEAGRLAEAVDLLGKDTQENASPERGSARALLEYRLGRPELALEIEVPLAAEWERRGDKAGAQLSRKRAEFYRSVVKLADRTK